MSELWKKTELLLRHECRDLLLWGDVIQAKTRNGVEVRAKELRYHVVVRIGEETGYYPKGHGVDESIFDICHELNRAENA